MVAPSPRGSSVNGSFRVTSFADLKVGDQVFVQSRVDGANVLAKHILQRPVAATTSGG